MSKVKGNSIAILCVLMFSPSIVTQSGLAADAKGVTVQLEDDQGTATIQFESVGQFQVKIQVDPKTEKQPLVIRVELPISGRHVWPIADVEVLDAAGQSISVRRGGIAWHKLLITVPATRGTFTVQANLSEDDGAQVLPEGKRLCTDSKTGLTASICKWHDGRHAALSIRFDDSHATHLSKAIPILNEYGFRGTFMVNPGGHLPASGRRSAFENQRAEWEAVANRGAHEFANHTMHHRGAMNDENMEREVGDAAKAIWKLSPKKSKLVALNLGGGTQWVTARTLRYYLDKYHLFDASANSTGMDDSYGKRVDTFRRLLEAHIQRGLWYRVHYHYIGDGLSSSEANFRAALDIAKEHQDSLWIAGMADIHKYQTERQKSQLVIENDGPSQVTLKVLCSTNPELYDHPLTLEIVLPNTWLADRVMVTGVQGKSLVTRLTRSQGQSLLRFEVQPRNGLYHVQLLP